MTTPVLGTRRLVSLVYGAEAYWAHEDTATALAKLVEAREALEVMVAALVSDYRQDNGATWAEVGAALSVSKQAAQQRYGRVVS